MPAVRQLARADADRPPARRSLRHSAPPRPLAASGSPVAPPPSITPDDGSVDGVVGAAGSSGAAAGSATVPGAAGTVVAGGSGGAGARTTSWPCAGAATARNVRAASAALRRPGIVGAGALGRRVLKPGELRRRQVDLHGLDPAALVALEARPRLELEDPPALALVVGVEP